VSSDYFLAALLAAVSPLRPAERRSEVRQPADPASALLDFRGGRHSVRLVNVSGSGAMIVFADSPNIGERVTLHLLDRGPVPSQVRWVKDGRVGLCFTNPRG
jgi:hypothetical protein